MHHGRSNPPRQRSFAAVYAADPPELPFRGDARTCSEEGGPLTARVLCVGGEDHDLRIPFMLALRQRGFDMIAVGTGDSAPFVRAGIDHHAFRYDRFANPLADLGAISRLKRLLIELQPAIAHSFDTKPNLMLPWAARGTNGVRVVRTINGLGWVYSSRTPAAFALRPIYRALHRLAARATAATIFQNREDQAFFKRHRMAGPAGGWLIPGSGIDIEGFERALAARPHQSELRRALDLGASELVVTVTRLTRQKGVPTLLEAAALVHKERPRVRFLLVGPRQSEGAFAVAQSDIDRHAAYVTALGRRSDVPALLAIADVFAFPTEYREGVPRALLEAGLAGLPIVATAMPGCSDVVRDGWSGFLVPPRAPRLLADRILDLLRDRTAARDMGHRAAAVVRREFGLDMTVGRYSALYEKLLDRPPAHAGAGSGTRRAILGRS